MRNLNQYLHDDKRASKGKISISGKLEGIVGKYYVKGEGNPEALLFTIYYDATIDGDYNSVETVEENIIGFVTADYEYAFVKESALGSFCRDTEEYNITVIPFTDINEQEFSLIVKDNLPEFLLKITWINDDFLYNEEKEFDYNTFEEIDKGISYLNPDHFSVKELAVELC